MRRAGVKVKTGRKWKAEKAVTIAKTSLQHTDIVGPVTEGRIWLGCIPRAGWKKATVAERSYRKLVQEGYGKVLKTIAAHLDTARRKTRLVQKANAIHFVRAGKIWKDTQAAGGLHSTANNSSRRNTTITVDVPIRNHHHKPCSGQDREYKTSCVDGANSPIGRVDTKSQLNKENQIPTTCGRELGTMMDGIMSPCESRMQDQFLDVIDHPRWLTSGGCCGIAPKHQMQEDST